ncbi:helix-turn-helix domain-containing protein [Dyadobacter sp. CY347]|uniref:helix-turn-helix domain-containing protein n=1 Tax=Dyadobacter sp. CY347 TaxID=2909336 RepID=UPI001F366B03|nr:helix-turn-helix domain-containing protein [Dyadobacter sp. CY347]MCF2491127.1 helix-turn-helix domain-containing protein [Dyadobacter sp. CY347]
MMIKLGGNCINLPHNLKVVSSNLAPATNYSKHLDTSNFELKKLSAALVPHFFSYFVNSVTALNGNSPFLSFVNVFTFRLLLGINSLYHEYIPIYGCLFIQGESPTQEIIMTKDTNSEVLLDRKTAAKYLAVSPGTLAVWDCTKRYDLKPIKVGRAVRYRRSDIDKFLEQRLVKR